MRIPPDIRFFVGCIILLGFSQAVFDSVFNNFLHDTFGLSGIQRMALELPRELPGVLVIVVSAVLFALSSRRLAFVALLLQAAGLLLISVSGSRYSLLLTWLFFYSLGQHVFLPLQPAVTMELAHKGEDGRRLGQINGIRNFAAIGGSFAVFLGFRYLHAGYVAAFRTAALGIICAAVLFFFLRPGEPHVRGVHLKFHRSYTLFYWLNILYGTRKQIFLTFAPWVLVTIYRQPTQMMATLLTVGGIIGIVFQPLLGKAVDRVGERAVLAGEALLLIVVCLLYGFARDLLSAQAALVVAGACYVTDQMLISVGMARATYLKKIALDPAHVAPTLSMGTSIDHVFSIAIALAGGVIWQKWGYQYVFLAGAFIALINFFSALRVTIPVKRNAESESVEEVFGQD